MTSTRFRTGLALAALALAFAQPSAAQSGRLAGLEVRIGAVVPSSGPFAEWGRTNTATLKMLEDEVNAAGGVEGAKLRVIVYDDSAKPPQAANLVRRLAEDDKVLAIAGPSARFVTALQPILRKTQGLPAEIEPSMYDANIYEIVSLYIDAIKKAGVSGKPDQLAQDREKIQKYVATSGAFTGFAGKVSFNPDGDAIKSFYIVVGQGGKWAERVRGCSAPGGKGC